MAEPATAPTRERGYVNGDGLEFHVWDETEQVPELRWPLSVRVFSRMAREDSRVTSVLQAIGLPIRRTPWRIDPNGAPDEVVEFVANDLGLPIAGGASPQASADSRFSWSEHLVSALLMLKYGHSYFEQVYRPGGDGRLHLHKLAARPQRTISAIHVALDGGLESIEQYSPSGTVGRQRTLYGVNGVTIPVNHLVAYVRDPEPGQWIGESLLRPAYKHWILKDELMRIQAVAARRNGIGVPDYMGQQGASDEDLKKARDLATSFRGTERAGMSRPYGSEFRLLGVQGNLPDLQRAIEYHDKQIALSGLAHFLNLDRGGSYALASVQADTFVQSVQTVAEAIAATATRHVVGDLVAVNFGDVARPRIVFDEIGSRQDATAAALKLLVEAGLLEADDVLKILVRQQYGLPAPDKATAVPAEEGGEDAA